MKSNVCTRFWERNRQLGGLQRLKLVGIDIITAPAEQSGGFGVPEVLFVTHDRAFAGDCARLVLVHVCALEHLARKAPCRVCYFCFFRTVEPPPSDEELTVLVTKNSLDFGDPLLVRGREEEHMVPHLVLLWLPVHANRGGEISPAFVDPQHLPGLKFNVLGSINGQGFGSFCLSGRRQSFLPGMFGVDSRRDVGAFYDPGPVPGRDRGRPHELQVVIYLPVSKRNKGTNLYHR
mmetsp:Transcript_19531/g.33520  ORF Transcript_19531/g.33520 Transcript_19531/m.33520 type:complete len:234 (-) Transcript_19531:279-980(-)